MPPLIRRQAPLLRLLLPVVLVLLAAVPGVASAAVTGSSLLSGDLHVAQGAITDPDGRQWVADHNGGFCRVTEAGWRGPGTLEHPKDAADTATRTCLGGLLPFAQPGPDAAINPVFLDPTPERAGSGDEMAFIADTATHSADVVRARWNPDTHLFDYVDVIKMDADPLWPDRPRPTGLTADDLGNLYVVFQRSQTIQRVVRPTSAQPLVETVGRIQGRRAAGIAAGFDRLGRRTLFVAELTGITIVRPDPIAQPTTTATNAPDVGTFFDVVEGLDVPNAVEALYYDLAARQLYAGTANAGTPDQAGTDVIFRYDYTRSATAAAPPRQDHVTGFSSVAAISGGTGPGELLVTHDAGVLDPAEPLGTGELRVVGRPVASIVSGPTAADGTQAADPRATADTSPSFTVAGDGTLECLPLRLASEPAPAPALWRPCTADKTITALNLPEGEYVAAVRAKVGSSTGVVDARTFRVDTTGPADAEVATPTGDQPVSRAPWFTFTSTDKGVRSWECRWQTAAATATTPAEWSAWAKCPPGRTRRFTEAGTYTLQVRGIDAAGNVGAPSAERTFTVDLGLAVGPSGRAFAATPDYPGNRSQIGGDLHITTGAIVDPNGRTWVADHNAGFCRMTETGLGRDEIEHPKLGSDTDTPRTCLGGLLPFHGTGPDAAGQPAFYDPTPGRPGSGDELAFIPDGASHSNQVVRAQWDAEDGLFKFKDTIAVSEVKPRPIAASIGPDGALYVVTKEQDTVERFVDPAAATPTPQIVGHTLSGDGPIGVAAGRATAGGPTVVYIAEPDRLTVVTPQVETAVRPAPTAAASFALPASAVSLSAAIYDLERDVLYVGTANGATQADAGTDAVHRIAIARGAVDAQPYSADHSMVGGFGLRPDGKLLILDDPALLDPAEPIGTGRLFLAGLPSAHIAKGPTDKDGAQAKNREFTNDTTPAFELSGPGTIQCALLADGAAAPADAAWTDCGTTFTTAGALADASTHVLAVRSVDRTGAAPVAGPVETLRFTVDTVAPGAPTIVKPAAAARTGASPWVDATTDEPASYECKVADTVAALDAAAFAPCAVPGRPWTFSADGEHAMVVRAVDRAGNVGPASAPRTWWSDGTVPSVIFDAPVDNVFTRDQSIQFRFHADEAGSTLECSVRGPGGIAEAGRCDDGTYALDLPATGTYTLTVQATDQHGNRGPLNDRRVVVDRAAPALNIVSPRANQAIRVPAVAQWTVNEPVTEECQLDGGAFQPCRSPAQLSDRLTTGAHTLVVRVTDLAGNVTEQARAFRVTGIDPNPPANLPGTELRPRQIGDAGAVPAPVTTLALVQVAPTVTADALLTGGLPVTVTTTAALPVVNLQVVGNAPVGTGAVAAAKRKPKVIASVTRRFAKAGVHRIRLRDRTIRRLKPGRYRLDVRAGRSARRLTTRLGSKRFTVKRRRR